MKEKMLLKENVAHGTALIPVSIHHLSYPPDLENFFYLHWHSEFELVAVTKGAVLYTVEDTEYCIMAGEGLFVNSNRLHAARSYNGMPCEALAIVFHPSMFGDGKQGAAYSKFVYPILSGEMEFACKLMPEEKWQGSVLERILEIGAIKDEDLSGSELLLKSKLFEIWHHCYKNSSAKSQYKDRRNYKLERLQPVLDHIHKNYKEEIALSTLANILPMSKGQFCRTFREVMNMPPVAYVIRFRILKSCTLLAETGWKISDIARSVGFGNISYFNREFLKAVGCSPSKYRREG